MLQAVKKLLLFKGNLRAVIKVLQGAATSAGEMFTQRVDAIRRWRDHPQDMPFIVIAFLIVTPKLDCLAGQCAVNKTRFAIYTAHATTIVD